MARVLRALHLAGYGAAAAIGMALAARPAVLWLRGVGMFGRGARWEVPLGPAFAATALAIIGCTAALAVRVCVRRKRGITTHAALLLAVAAAVALRGAAREPRPAPINEPTRTRQQLAPRGPVPLHPDARLASR